MGLRIFIASDHYPPFYGGAHRQTELLAHELQLRGHEVCVATVWHPGLPTEQDASGVAVRRVKQLRTWLPWLSIGTHQRHQPPFPDPISIIGLRRLIKDFQPDIVHSYGWISYSVAVALWGKDIPMLISARDYGYFCPTRSLLHNDHTCSGPELFKCLQCATGEYGAPKGVVSTLSVISERSILLRKTRGIHSVSQYVQEAMEHHLLGNPSLSQDGKKAGIIQNVIPSFLLPEESDRDPDFSKRLPSEPFILYVGGLQHRKGVGSLLTAYQKLRQPPPLVLIGYPAKDMPAKYPPGVTVLMSVPHTDVMEAWDRCLFGVTPSLWPDPSPGVVREAMSRGRAIIVTSVGGSSEMINEDKNGLLVPPGDDQALALAMQRLVDDPGLRERLGKSGIEWSKQYMADNVVPQFERLYQQLIKTDQQRDGDAIDSNSKGKKILNIPILNRLIDHLRSPLYFNGYALTVSSAATSIIGLLYWLLAARYYPPEIVGRNSAAISTILFLSGLAGLNLDATLVRFIPRAGWITPRLVRNIYIISILVAAMVSPIFLAGIQIWSPALSFLRSNNVFAIIFVLAVLTGCIFVQEDGVLTGLREAKWVAVENSTYAVLKLALLILFASFLPQYGILMSWILPVMILIPFVNFFIFRRLIPIHINGTRALADKISIGNVTKYTASNYLGYLFYLAYSMLPPLMVIQFAGSRANAYFYLPWVIFSSLRLYIINMGTSLTVEGSLDQSRLLLYFRQILAHTVKVLLPIVFIVVVAAPIGLGLFGHDYAVFGTPLLRLLTLSVIPSTLVSLYLGVLRLQYQFGQIVLIQGVFAALALGLSYFLLPVYGITGVGIAWLVTQTAMAGIILISQFKPIFHSWKISNETKKGEKLTE